MHAHIRTHIIRAAAAVAFFVVIGSLAAFPAEPAGSLYADLGGASGVARIVDATAAAFLADDRIKGNFEDINMPRFRRLLAEKICEVSDGGCVYTGHPMRVAHKGLHLRMRDFNAVVEDLQSAMEGLGVAFSTQNRLLARLGPMQRDVVTR